MLGMEGYFNIRLMFPSEEEPSIYILEIITGRQLHR
jgi:hypothetical protein